MKYADMMQKCEYTHFETWILNGEITKNLAPIDKQAILQQVLVRDKEIMELQDKLSRRNMQIKELKKRRISGYSVVLDEARLFEFHPYSENIRKAIVKFAVEQWGEEGLKITPIK